MTGVFSRGIARIPYLAELLHDHVVMVHTAFGARRCKRIAGWGLRPTATRARRIAAQHAIPYLALEDGFLRSVGLGNQTPPLSIVLDDIGVYYDATRPSRLEQQIPAQLNNDETSRAQALMRAWREARVSKYNHMRETYDPLPERFVLVADQTAGDASIRFGMASAESFKRMLSAALERHPDCTVVLKVHPDVVAGRKRGHFDLTDVAQNSRIRILAEDLHPVVLLERSAAVYVVTSQLGFEGLLWGKPVYTFGMPFYAGWGLTVDALAAPTRRSPASLEQLIHAALVMYPRYIDPETGCRCAVERVLEWMALQRRMQERFPARLFALDFSFWKRQSLRSFFRGSAIKFVNSVSGLPKGATLLVWGMKPVRGILPDKVAMVRLEDGFLRSVGLGTDLTRPVSWTVDQQGIYFDATRPSDLEALLLTTEFNRILLNRAATLRERLVNSGLTKYNVGGHIWLRPVDATRVILVPGQVESDASLAYGAPGIATNMGLLQAVREANPDAWIVYKPHPDVLAGLRAKGRDEDRALAWCNEQVTNVAMGELLPQMDEVHTLTSLTGFEALLRGKKVICYGQPFFAGWGLTIDRLPLARRSRSLTLDELVAGALILYPVYVSRTTGRFTTPEQTLDELLTWREQPARLSLWIELKRKLLRLIVGVR